MTGKRSRVIPAAVRRAVMWRDKFACRDCGEPEQKIPHGRMKVTNLHLHHIVEFESGGEHTEENLITVCHRCHEKRDREHRLALCRKAADAVLAEFRARGLICLREAAEVLGVRYERIWTLIYRHKLEVHQDRHHSLYKFLSLAKVEALKAQSIPRAEAA